jgi:hypothetical protein
VPKERNGLLRDARRGDGRTRRSIIAPIVISSTTPSAAATSVRCGGALADDGELLDIADERTMITAFAFPRP